VDFVRRWSEKTKIGAGRFIEWLDITASKFYNWRERHGKVNGHNGWVPRDFWLEEWEKQAIIGFHLKNPLQGYRRLPLPPRGCRCLRAASNFRSRSAWISCCGTAPSPPAR